MKLSTDTSEIRIVIAGSPAEIAELYLATCEARRTKRQMEVCRNFAQLLRSQVQSDLLAEAAPRKPRKSRQAPPIGGSAEG